MPAAIIVQKWGRTSEQPQHEISELQCQFFSSVWRSRPVRFVTHCERLPNDTATTLPARRKPNKYRGRGSSYNIQHTVPLILARPSAFPTVEAPRVGSVRPVSACLNRLLGVARSGEKVIKAAKGPLGQLARAFSLVFSAVIFAALLLFKRLTDIALNALRLCLRFRRSDFLNGSYTSNQSVLCSNPTGVACPQLRRWPKAPLLLCVNQGFKRAPHCLNCCVRFDPLKPGAHHGNPPQSLRYKKTKTPPVLGRNPCFTIVAVLSLALGIVANPHINADQYALLRDRPGLPVTLVQNTAIRRMRSPIFFFPCSASRCGHSFSDLMGWPGHFHGSEGERRRKSKVLAVTATITPRSSLPPSLAFVNREM